MKTKPTVTPTKRAARAIVESSAETMAVGTNVR